MRGIGSLGSDDDDNGKKNNNTEMISKTKNLQVHHAFLYISLRSLNDHDPETA